MRSRHVRVVRTGQRALITALVTGVVVIGAGASVGQAAVTVPDTFDPKDRIKVAFPSGTLTIDGTPRKVTTATVEDSSLLLEFAGGKARFAVRDDAATGDVFVKLNNGRKFRGTDVRVFEAGTGAGSLRVRGELIPVGGKTAVSVKGSIPAPLVGAGTSEIFVKDGSAFLFGTLGAKTTRQIRALIQRRPKVRTLVLAVVPGSDDDDANIVNGSLVRKAKFTTIVPRGGLVASGGTDLLISGKKRVVEAGARVGVHSWAEAFGGLEGTDLPRSHPAHRPYLRFNRTMLGARGRGFYFFTLQAAPASRIHYMTRAELLRWKVIFPTPKAFSFTAWTTGARSWPTLATLPVSPSLQVVTERAVEVVSNNLVEPEGVTVRATAKVGDPSSVLVNVLGYQDDSIAGVQVRLFMSNDADGWRVTAVESRRVCRRGVDAATQLCL